MRDRKSLSPPELTEPSASDRLDSWKEIAAYLKRDESTVRRWEKEGLPVQRHVHMKKATVYAYRSAIDVWWNDGRARLELTEAAANASRRRLAWWVAAGLTLLSMGMVGLNVGRVRDRLLGRPVAGTITSIAVLPLENLSGDPEQEYFADGVTDALITELAKIKPLRVISRQSVMQFKGSKRPMAEIARTLDVDAVVEGTVAREGNQIRVTAQLIQLQPERHLWAERYQRDLTSILILQNEVARAIATEVGAKLSPQERALLAKARAVNPLAYEAYVKGVFFTEKLGEEGITKGIAYSRQAIEIDPTYAPAYVALADGYNRAAIHGFQPASEAYPKAKAAASTALRLDDQLAEAYTLQGVIKFHFDWDSSGAERDLKRALQLNPSSSRAHLAYSTLLLALGRLDEAIAVAKQNIELDPLTAQRHEHLAWLLFYARHYDDAVTRSQKALELEPDLALAYMMLAISYAAKGMHSEAIAACEGALHLSPESEVLSYCGRVYVQAGRRREAHDLLQRMLAQTQISQYSVALLDDELGYQEDALRQLEEAYRAHDANLCFLRIDFSAQLHSDPRFQDLLRRMNFPR